MNVTLLIQQVHTERKNPKNKPVIIIRGNGRGICVVIDVAVSGDRNVMKKGAENNLKYKSITTPMRSM